MDNEPSQSQHITWFLSKLPAGHDAKHYTHMAVFDVGSQRGAAVVAQRLQIDDADDQTATRNAHSA